MTSGDLPICVTGTGALTCVGAGVENLWNAAIDRRSGIKNGLGHVSDSDLVNPALSRTAEMSMIAIQEAMKKSGWTELRPDDGLILATTSGQIPIWDKALSEFLGGRISQDAFSEVFRHQPLGSLVNDLCRRLEFNGRTLLVSSACSASTQALAVAGMWLNSGRVRRVLVGGVEVFCDLIIEGFRSLQLLSSEATKPFDQSRAGINLSEGAGFLCLEREPHSEPLAILSGFGVSSDGYHMTAPHPEGRGCREAMKNALQTAGLSPDHIDWIHAHGTGSTHNDLAEGIAIRAVFEGRVPPVSSSKWIHGHALGATGAIESILCIEALRHQIMLESFGLQTPDENIPLQFPRQNTETQLRHILKNTLGFGGSNAALVLSSARGMP